MRGPDAFIRHLTEHHYHPRSDAHSNAVCRAILDDLIAHCRPLAEKARGGELVATLNHTVKVNYQDWNIDLAIGPPPGLPTPPVDGPIAFSVPATIEVGVEAKTVMTEHGKARRNRLRDLQAFHGYAHAYNPKTIAVGTVAVNVSAIFWSPLREANDVTHHRNIGTLGPKTVEMFRGLPLRHTPDEGPGLEAACVLVVKLDNLAKNPAPPLGVPDPHPPTLVTGPPAPQVGDPLHYATMIQRICTAYRARWC
jgi:hypothetical protein